MLTTIDCPECGRKLQMGDCVLGNVQCPCCSTTFRADSNGAPQYDRTTPSGLEENRAVIGSPLAAPGVPPRADAGRSYRTWTRRRAVLFVIGLIVALFICGYFVITRSLFSYKERIVGVWEIRYGRYSGHTTYEFKPDGSVTIWEYPSDRHRRDPKTPEEIAAALNNGPKCYDDTYHLEGNRIWIDRSGIFRRGGTETSTAVIERLTSDELEIRSVDGPCYTLRRVRPTAPP
jgi:hypothetical protein